MTGDSSPIKSKIMMEVFSPDQDKVYFKWGQEQQTHAYLQSLMPLTQFIPGTSDQLKRSR